MPIQLPKLPAAIVKRLSAFNSRKPEKELPYRALGVNIGRANIVLSQVLKEEGKFVLERCIQRQISKETTVGHQLKELIEEFKLALQDVRVSLKGQGVVVRFLSFPKMNRSEFGSAIQFEAEKYLPFSSSEVSLDYHLLGGSDLGVKVSSDMMRVILVAGRKTEVDKLVHTTQEAGCRLSVIDLDVFALVNAFQHSLPEEQSQVVALIDFGAVDTTLAVLHKGNLIFCRDISFGSYDLAEFVRRKLDIPLDDANRLIHEMQIPPDKLSVIEEGLGRLFQELNSSLTYYYDQHEEAEPIKTVFTSGGFSQFCLLADWLEKRLQVVIKTWDSTVGLEVGETVDRSQLKTMVPYLPVSIGLAIRSR